MTKKEPCTRCGQLVQNHFLVTFAKEDDDKTPYNPITKNMRICCACVENMLEKLDKDDELRQISNMREGLHMEWEEIGMKIGESAFNVKAKYHRYLDRTIKELDPEVFGTIHALNRAKWPISEIYEEINKVVPEDGIKKIIINCLWKKRGESA